MKTVQVHLVIRTTLSLTLSYLDEYPFQALIYFSLPKIVDNVALHLFIDSVLTYDLKLIWKIEFEQVKS